MPGPRTTPRALAAAALAVLTACTSGSGSAPTPGPGTPSPSPAEPPAELEVRVSKVQALTAGAKVRPKHVRPLADRVAETMEGLYRAGFVEAPGGPAEDEVLRHFRGEARDQAEGDLRHLTLGPAAGELASVVPRRAVLRVTFLMEGPKRPAAALAQMSFVGAGKTADGEKSKVKHRATYMLRRYDGRWMVDGYRVKRHLAPEGFPGMSSRKTMYVLVIGSDSRPGRSPSAGLADSLHIVGINLRKGKASILGIPRDSYVPIPGAGTQKINASLFRGGPQRTVDTVERLSGLRIDAYVLTAFEGFRRMVTAVGGITVRVPYPMNDSSSGARFSKGPKRMEGRAALAFSRNRKGAPGGDFGRSLNQGEVLLAALRELKNDARKDPMTLFTWVVAGAQNVQTNLTPGQMLALLQGALSIDPSKVRNRVVSGSGGTAGGASVVRLTSGAYAMFRDMKRNGLLGG